MHTNVLLEIKRVQNAKFLNRRCNVIKMSIVPKIIDTTKVIAGRKSVEFLCEIYKLYIMKNQLSRLIRGNVGKKE